MAARKPDAWLDDWIAIGTDGMVTAFSGKVELGTGVRTALAQIVAEELDVPLERVRMVMGDTALTPDEGYTAGSMTISSSGTALRLAAAEARRAMLEMASERLDATLEELSVQEGAITVTHDPQRSLTYAELMGGKRFNLRVTDQAPLKPPETYQIVGTSVPREDLPRKVAGQPVFIHDVRVPEMLHARLVRPPSSGAKLMAMDESSVKDMPGLVKVVQRGDFIGVVAEREEQAIRAARQLHVQWQAHRVYPRMEDLYRALREQPTEDRVLVEQGNLEQAFAGATRQAHATYYQPYHAHASIGPSCAVADVQGDRVTVWSSTQGPYPLRGALAELLNFPADNVHLIHVEGAGCYGQNGSDDVAADAVILSQAVGRPVRVLWSRAEEFLWEPKSPAMAVELHGGLDSQGSVVAWEYQVWSPSHARRPRVANQLLTAQLLAGEPAPTPRFSYGAERNAPTNYAFPAQRVTVHYVPDSFLRVSSFRSLGGSKNTFANESFIDELAAAVGADPIEYRLRYLHDPRERAVLAAAAEKADWESRPSPRTSESALADGRGVAFARYENDQAIVACVAEVQVERDTGVVRVKRLVVAHDCGLIINPDGVRNQIEGNLIQSLSRALKEEVEFDETRITSVDWGTYPILTFSEVPAIEILLIDRPDQPALGAGEPATVITAPAVANAIFDATGIRLRQTAFTPERVREALSERGKTD
ncbi:MAG TPA: molybdopterin cofactor-binding domain-containing protein [Anaerolineales bacterium]|jgi:CO/xanthine dehydrogenase Mo-binding subunit|nr:molybdopterin cofactor-binding domain-containing protein [Anaerolineales bacterium]